MPQVIIVKGNGRYFSFPIEKKDNIESIYKNPQIFEVDDSFKFSKDNCIIMNINRNEPYENRLFTCAHLLGEYAKQKGLKVGEDLFIENVNSTSQEEEEKMKDGCTQTGIWLLSYISSQGYVEIDDDVWSDYLSGTLKKPLPGILSKIPVGSLVYIVFDACREKVTAYWKTKTEEDEEDEDIWCWERIPKEQIIEGQFSWTFS